MYDPHIILEKHLARNNAAIGYLNLEQLLTEHIFIIIKPMSTKCVKNRDYLSLEQYCPV